MQNSNRFIRLSGQITLPPSFGYSSTGVPKFDLSIRAVNLSIPRNGIPRPKLVHVWMTGEAAEHWQRDIWGGNVITIEGEGRFLLWLSEEDRENAEYDLGTEVYDGEIVFSDIYRIARQEAKNYPGPWPRFRIS